MRRSLAFLIMWASVFSPASLISQTFSLTQILSAPFPSNLVAAAEKDRIAWIFNDQGKRNVFIADAPDFAPIQITHFDRDDGQELGQLQISNDGTVAVFVRGGRPNRQGENPNPTSNPEGAEQAVWAVRLPDGEPWRISPGSNPVLSPNGSQLIFSSRRNLFRITLSKEAKPSPLFHLRGRNYSPVWSPDGSKVAFVSDRADHSYIGVFDIATKKLIWLCPGVDRDFEPVWSPDGKRVAFFRYPGEMASPPPAREPRRPFAIWVADVSTGEGHRVWNSPDSSGGFAQYYPAHPLMWGKDDHLVFYSEHEGWMHLYSLSLHSKKAICLTPGKFEVEDASLSPDRSYVVFNSNQDDIDRRHLWRVSVSGGPAESITRGKGLEWAPVMTASGKYLIFFCSTAFQPAAPAVMQPGKKNVRLVAKNFIPADFPEKQLVEPRQVIFHAGDGLEIHGQLFMPRKKRGKLPAIIFMHGGPIRQMMLGWHMRGYYHNAYGMNQYLASRGYVVLSVNYRSGIGYGRAFRMAAKQGPRGASEYQDIVAAAKFLQSLPEVDPQRIGLWGGSYGGYLTALGLARDSDLFAAGVDLHGVHDWSLRARRRGSRDWGISGEELMRLAFESSPVADVEFWTSPVLFIHGDDDRNVDFIQTVDLVQRLRQLGRAHVEYLIFPDEVHGFLRHESWIRAYSRAADFFERFLKK